MSTAIYPALIRGLTYTVMKTPSWDTIVQKSPNGYETRLAQMSNPIWHWTLIYDYLYDTFPSPNNTKPYSPYTDFTTLLGFFLARQGMYDNFLYTDPTDNYVGPALISSSPNVQAELQIVNDGAGNYYSPVQRNMGGMFYEDVTDLNGSITVYANGALQTGGGTNYTLGGPGLAIPGYSFMGLYLQWTNAVAATWTASHTYALNAEIMDPAGHIQKATTAGTSGTAIPSFNDTGGTTPDGTGSLMWTDQGYNAGPAGPITAQFNFYFRVRFETDDQDFENWAGGLWTIGGSKTKNGSGMLKLITARPATP